MWHVYWHTGESYRRGNALQARRKLPQWFLELDADAVEAACLRDVLAGVRDRGGCITSRASWSSATTRCSVAGIRSR